MALSTLNDDQRLYIQTIFDYFHEHGKWPTYKYIDRKLTLIRRDLDIEKIAKGLPSGFASTSSFSLRLEDEAILSISAIYLCAGSGEELADFIKVLHHFVEKYFSDLGDSVEVSSDDLIQHLGMSELSVRKVGLLIKHAYEYYIYTSFREDNVGNNWVLPLSRSIREFDGVTSIEQYFEKLDQIKKRLTTPEPRLPLQEADTDTSRNGDQYNISRTSGEVTPLPVKIKIFFCYAHEDEPLLNRLKIQLISMQRRGLIEMWHDRDINAGTEWEGEISEQINTAQIILLLISPDFMASDYCYGIEMKRALERHKNGEACVIPVILRPVHWQDILGNIQSLPNDGNPVTSSSWHSPDDAFFDVAEGIRRVIEEMTAQISTNDLLQKKVRDRFEKFTEQAKIVLFFAQEEAQRFQQEYIGTEHLLLGLIHENKSIAVKVLNNIGINLNKLRKATESVISHGDRTDLGELKLTIHAKKVIELAVDEALRLNHHYIRPEHLLLGLVREGEGIGAGVLDSFGVTLEKVRRETIKVLSQN
jgi:hypothetical protein